MLVFAGRLVPVKYDSVAIQRHFDVSDGDIRFQLIFPTRLQLDSWRAVWR